MRKPFKTAVLVLIWGWILLFVLVPNLLLIVMSFLIRRHDPLLARRLETAVRCLYPDGFVPRENGQGNHTVRVLTGTSTYCQRRPMR
ncbi:MAG: hypothetical protein ABF290_12590 [Thiogranum sp.]